MVGTVMRTSLVVVLAASLSLGLVACKGDQSASPPAASAQTTTAVAQTSATTSAAASAAAPEPASDVRLGAPPPDFTATAQDGTQVHLAALKGKPVVVYFYPKDETAGCTKEACSFRDSWEALSKKGVVLIGISADNDDSHRAFVKNHQLPFLLVSDPKGEIAGKFGVPMMMGTMTSRQSFVIGADGNVKKIYRDVDVTVHAQQILSDLS